MDRQRFTVPFVVSAVVAMSGAIIGCYGPVVEEFPYYDELELPDTPVPDDIGATVFIKGGTFMMGAPDNAEENPLSPRELWIRMARPLHEETVPSFEIGKYKVTATEFAPFLTEVTANHEDPNKYYYLKATTGENTGTPPLKLSIPPTSMLIESNGVFKPRPGYEWAPVRYVSYRGARRYCEWLSEKTGDKYRLPSEIEWEYTARGSEGRTFPWGEESPVGRAFLSVLYLIESRIPATHVGTFPNGATPQGVHDLIGDTPEWCGNYLYDYSYESIGKNPTRFYQFAHALDPVGANSKNDLALTVKRGGGYIDRIRKATATGWSRLDGGSPDVVTWRGGGLRVLKEIEEGPDSKE